MKLGCCLIGLLLICFLATLLYAPVSQAVACDLGLAFGLRFFDKLCREGDGEENVLFSPQSAHMCLSLVANGASGLTAQELLTALGADSGLGQLNSENEKSLASLTSLNSSLKLESANAIFASKSAPILSQFAETCQKNYQAEVRNLDFASPEALVEINKWCAEKTHDKISSILSRLNQSDIVVLLNALYFKGTWDSTFKPANTRPGDFSGPGLAHHEVSMMHQTHYYEYLQTGAFSAIEMPYKGGQASLFVFLPEKNVSLKQLRERFLPDNWRQWMTSFKPEKVAVQLPKFKVQFGRTLNPVLADLGIKAAFDRGRADFSKMVPPPHHAFLSLVVQKTYMEVDEQGTEAAAVTAVAVAMASCMPQPPKQFVVDRPFLIALRNNISGEILFLGQIVDPVGH